MADLFSERVAKYGTFLNGGPNGTNQATSTIWLRFEDSADFAWLRFYPTGYQLPECYEVEDEDGGPSKYVVSYRSGDYLKVIDLLRNESPVVFYWNAETGAAFLRSGAEDVGEGEMEELEP